MTLYYSFTPLNRYINEISERGRAGARTVVRLVVFLMCG